MITSRWVLVVALNEKKKEVSPRATHLPAIHLMLRRLKYLRKTKKAEPFNVLKLCVPFFFSSSKGHEDLKSFCFNDFSVFFGVHLWCAYETEGIDGQFDIYDK